MKIVCQREPLMAAFQVAASVAPQRSPKEILRNVKIEAGEQVLLSATDMEIGVQIRVDGVTVETPGSAILPVARFGTLLRESSDEQLKVEASHTGLTIAGDRSRFKLPAENPDEFPRVPQFAHESYYQITSRQLKELIRRTAFATDNESSRFALGGVLFEFEGDRVTAVGTDGRRLAKMEGATTCHGEPAQPDAMTIVPTKSLQVIERALSDDDGEIKMAARANEVMLESARFTMFSRLVEGRFPRWRDVFPKRSGSVQMGISVGPFQAAVRQAAVVASEDSRGIDMQFAEGTLVMAGRSAEIGESRVEIPIPYDGDPLHITLDHRFLLDFLKVLSPDSSVMLDVQDSEAAALFTTEDGYGYVIMPLARDG